MSYKLLAEVLVGNNIGRVAGLANQPVRVDAKLRFQEGLCSFLGRSPGRSLRERMIHSSDTIGLEGILMNGS